MHIVGRDEDAVYVDDIRRWSDSYLAGMIDNTREPDVIAAAQEAYDEAQTQVLAAVVPIILGLPELTMPPTVKFVGWQFRGPLGIPATFEPAA